METQGVALGYVGDKIRYIVIIRVRFTAEFFPEHGFISKFAEECDAVA